MLRVCRIAGLADYRLSPRSVGVRTLVGRTVRAGVGVVGLTHGLAAVCSGCCCSSSVGPGIRVVRRSPVGAAVWSVGRTAIPVGSSIGIVGVVAVGGGVWVIESAIHVGRIVITSAAGHDSPYRGAHDERSHVSRGVACLYVA